ncbi:MAG: 3-deoxy-manno-octulosonate cytidylyltransferase [Opitutales bacterium]|jgi:3-deoxy-manno-octulosonate cytidylyltransferase (CMP-KDO synthetase)
MSSVTLCIPARLASTRLPRKVLLDLGGKPVVQRVWERARQVRQAARVVLLTDSEEVATVARGFGAEVMMTDPACPSGTARMASVMDRLDGDFFLNVQGDEPFIAPDLLDALISRWKETGCPLVTAVSRIADAGRLLATSVVKVVRAENGEAIYFSRSPVPHLRGVDPSEWTARRDYWAHVGVYGYDRATLAAYPRLGATELEAAESLEQLRFLAHGMTFQTVVTGYHPVAIDTPEDLEAARKMV